MSAVRLKGIAMTYPGPPVVQALRDVDLTVPEGDFVAIVGPSGSGKSTLLNILGLLDRPTAGSYELAGVDVAALGERDRAAVRGQRLGFVFQSFHLLDQRSALENVMLAALYQPRRAARRSAAGAGPAQAGRMSIPDRAAQVLASVGLSHRKVAMPSHLSGGERQRVAIARALMNSPSLLLCDEPTGNLDTANTAKVMSLLQDLNSQGQTVVIITHDRSVAERAKRRVSITDGILTEVHR
ncbi:ABC transporter ATP-binding protein [Nocardioides dubius]|uniref:ABC transporter ATP-binding protein n=1 Tax=Nocardioides dubius TaxID=317019 RepID=A0ABN1TX24_9ACTN